jgi:hypothetical protein
MTHDDDKAAAAIVRRFSSVALRRGDDVIVSASSGALEYRRLLNSREEAKLLRSVIREHCQEVTAHSSVRYQKEAIASAMARFDRCERTIKDALSITASSSAAE